MRTSSIAAAAVLTVVSLNQAIAGGWVVSARPNVVPLTRMVGVPFNRAPASFGSANRFGQFNHFAFANRFGNGFRPFGGFGFQRPFGQFAFQQPFGPFGFQRPAGFATIISLGEADPSVPPPVVDEAAAPQIIWAPSYVTVVAGGQRCGFAGGPKIIEIGESAGPTRAKKLPVVIYGAHGACPS